MRPAARTLPLLIATVTFSLLAAGCGGHGSNASRKPSAGNGFPVTLHPSTGSVRVASRPKRIVSLSPTGTEMLYAAGAGRQVVAVDDQSDYPKRAPRTSLSGVKPNAEAVIKRSPDLVVLDTNSNGIVKALAKVKIPVIQVPAPRDLNGSYRELRLVGRATGHSGGAARTVARMKKQIRGIVAHAPEKRRSYYYELDNTYYTATSKTFIGNVFHLFGMRNIADPADKQHSGYPKLSAEYVVKSDPDMIFLADGSCCGQTPAKVAHRPGWSHLRAVTHHNVVPVNDDLASRWGPRTVQLVKAVARAVEGAGSPR